MQLNYFRVQIRGLMKAGKSFEMIYLALIFKQGCVDFFFLLTSTVARDYEGVPNKVRATS